MAFRKQLAETTQRGVGKREAWYVPIGKVKFKNKFLKNALIGET